MYFDSEFSSGQDLSERLLKFYRGLEHLHRLATKGDDRRDSNPFLNKRLREVMLSAPHYDSLLGNIADFSDICTQVRNYYTHLDRGGLEKKLKKHNKVVRDSVIECIDSEVDLEILYLKLKFLFQVQFIGMIGLKDKTKEIMNLNPLFFKLEQLGHKKLLQGNGQSEAKFKTGAAIAEV